MLRKRSAVGCESNSYLCLHVSGFGRTECAGYTTRTRTHERTHTNTHTHDRAPRDSHTEKRPSAAVNTPETKHVCVYSMTSTDYLRDPSKMYRGCVYKQLLQTHRLHVVDHIWTSAGEGGSMHRVVHRHILNFTVGLSWQGTMSWLERKHKS